MNIKQAAEQSGVSARNIRYYEQAGLLTPARNPENEYRIYSQADVRALKLIRMLRTLDMPVEEIGTVLNGTLPLAEAAERQRQRLEAEQQKLAAAAAFCTELAAGDRTAAELDVDSCLERMDSLAPAGGWFTDWVQDYRKMAAAEHKRQFTFTPDTAIATPQEFTAELLAWAANCGEEIVITHEGMTPRFTLDGIEYRAVRYSSHVRNIPILRVRCEVCDPSALAVEGDALCSAGSGVASFGRKQDSRLPARAVRNSPGSCAPPTSTPTAQVQANSNARPMRVRSGAACAARAEAV